jgi:hypothetical protein
MRGTPLATPGLPFRATLPGIGDIVPSRGALVVYPRGQGASEGRCCPATSP